MNTRAASILLFIFEIMAVLIVVYTATTIAQRAGNSATVQKINVAEDVRMMVHTLAAVPGDAEVQYPHEVKHSILLSGAVVSAFSPGDRETVWVKRKLVLPEGYAAQGAFEAEGKLCIQKKEKAITLYPCKKEEQ